MPINDIDKEIIKQTIQTDAGFKQFVAIQLVLLDNKVDEIAKTIPNHNRRLYAIEENQKKIQTGWNTLKWVCGLLWGAVVFIVGLLYKESR